MCEHCPDWRPNVQVNVLTDKEYAESRLNGMKEMIDDLGKDQQQELYQYMHNTLGLRIYK